ncbi:MAE_28990/MAE_18760 family HEPN-like nuclease [Inquilinus sp. NPDC058860]|uniref:MAE_28990/MAE_18760 family HEPN-like nuclease n=1 Tax=Inquilinus sp. NPDC058860 TaxID=3346652 RepID=UPI0036A1FAFD
MSSEFSIILEEFDEELEAIRAVILAFSDPKAGTPKTRVASVNSATLLLAATFEEFVREMARTYARSVVRSSKRFEEIPKKIASTAWKRSMEYLARLHIDIGDKSSSHEALFSDALARFNAIYEFCRGDLTQDVYKDLIHNEHNMRPNEINGLFKVSDLTNICRAVCDKKPLLDTFSETQPEKTHGQLLSGLEDFFERRNQIAHSIAIMRSSGPDLVLKDINLLSQFGKALCETLETVVPRPKDRAVSERPSADL